MDDRTDSSDKVLLAHRQSHACMLFQPVLFVRVCLVNIERHLLAARKLRGLLDIGDKMPFVTFCLHELLKLLFYFPEYLLLQLLLRLPKLPLKLQLCFRGGHGKLLLRQSHLRFNTGLGLAQDLRLVLLIYVLKRFSVLSDDRIRLHPRFQHSRILNMRRLFLQSHLYHLLPFLVL